MTHVDSLESTISADSWNWDESYKVIPNQLQNMNQDERDRLRTCYQMSQEALVNIAQDSKSVDPK